MKKGEKTQVGFTIIEVSLVLAIAGLIFLMIFIALPALQRQQRNTAREEDMIGLVTAIKKFQSNNRGALPSGSGNYTFNMSSSSATNWGGFLDGYLDPDSFIDPTGESYKLSVSSCKGTNSGRAGDKCTVSDGAVASSFPNSFTVYVVTQAACASNENDGVIFTANPRKVAIMYRLEGGGLYCINT